MSLGSAQFWGETNSAPFVAPLVWSHSPNTLSSTPVSNGFKTVTPFHVNPFCKSSDSKNRHPAAAAADRMIESQIPRLCPAARSIALASTPPEVSIEENASCQLRIASRARAGVRPAFRTSTVKSSPSACTGTKVSSLGSFWRKASAAFLREAPLTPSAYARTFVSRATRMDRFYS